MATITLKNIPDDLHRRLKESAAQHHRSMNKEIIARLEEQLMPPKRDTDAKLAELRTLRRQLPVYATPEEIDAAKDEGRP
ncbi:MAG: Arc family DNA-binding protein [Sulfuricellaceae bacterium]|nr:Arc family DNA-binding protein [Sulfuricellaceae bacterium]